MKKFTITILTVFLFSAISIAQNSYNNLWKQVEKLELENLPKSALKIVETIYTDAEETNNSQQLIKSLFYQNKYTLILEEDAQFKIITNLKKHIASSNFPTKNILQNIVANLYWQYYKNNRSKFYKRTETNKKANSSDFRTWDLNTLFKEVHNSFMASLQNSGALQKVNISDYKEILILQEDYGKYQPTLLDFLTNNALQFYTSSENSINRPAYKFVIDTPNFLKDYKSFSKLKIDSKDSLSLELHALKLYQKSIQFHFKENNTNALAYIDTKRIDFVKNHLVTSNKDSVYISTLKKSNAYLKNTEASVLYAYKLAHSYKEKNNNKTALKICNQVIKQYPESIYGKNCLSLKNRILEKHLSIQAEAYIPINKNSRLLVTYNNIDHLYFSAYQLTEKQFSEYHKIYKIDEKIKFINALESTKKWQSKLRNELDYNTHTTETIVPKLNNGRYLIIASEDKKYTNKIFGTTTLQVTNFVLIENNFNNRYNFQVVNRNNGAPIKNAQIYLKKKTSKNTVLIDKKLTTNKLGFAKFINKVNLNNVNISVKTKNDFAYFGSDYFSERRKKREKKTSNYDEEIIIKPFIFTDRSIYRPGQTIYFKTIVLMHQKGIFKPFKNEYIEVTLYDVNGKDIKTLDLKLNEFGATSGNFKIPNNGLTGEFSIEIDESDKYDSQFYDNEYYDFDYNSSRINISVEEYKRPKFEAKFKATTATYKINDSVTINGFAKAFSGSTITEAKVVYRVHRKIQYPNWWHWRQPNFTSSAQEITHGETITDEKGNFKITFKAIPDEQILKESLPIFKYEVTADVTDINGETRSTISIINVGYHSLLATISGDDKLDKTKKEHLFSIKTQNLNNQFVPAKGIFKIYKLQAPKNPLRKRPWSIPDYQNIPEKEFRQLFPNDAYFKHENDDKNWKKGKLVYSSNFDTKNSKTIKLTNLKNWLSGKYVILLESTDRFNTPVKDEKRITLFSSENKEVADSNLFTINTSKNSYKVGDIAEVNIASASKDISVTIQIEKAHKIVDTKIITLNNNSKSIKIPVTEQDANGFAVKWHFVNYNSFESGNLVIDVAEKEENTISIETAAFRDKLAPGQKETWSFSVKNDENNAVSSEILASMYDASLDQFKPHNWSFKTKKRKKKYYSYNTSSASKSFSNNYFSIKNKQRKSLYYSSILNNTYNWFGFYFLKNYRNKFKYYSRSISSVSNIRGGRELNGVVLDVGGNPIPGVSILVKGTSWGTVTDFDGYYSIGIKNGETLIYSYLGFKTQEISIGSSTNLNIVLEDSAEYLEEIVVVGYTKVASIKKKKDEGEDEESPDLSKIKARKNFKETAFFFPHLKTDENGKVSFSFTMPEALTRWKLQLLAHTQQLQSATKTLQTVTQKELMVIPNAPRFLREGDTITLSAKIANLTENMLNGMALLTLTDAVTGKNIDIDLQNTNASKNFTVNKNGNTNVFWHISIPETVQAVQYKIVAKAGNFSDGEQNVLPVLSNRMLVTETLPMWVGSNQTKKFTLNKLKNTTSSTLKNHKLTLEITSNPAWYAIQALPYLMEYPFECAEQTFSRYYANTLASFVTNSNPKIKEVFSNWKSSDALLSNLEKNQELKSLLIQETPWLRDAQSETEQKKRIALLFDVAKMKNEQQKSIKKLQSIQMNSGGFPWFKGSRYESIFITQHIAAGFGHLQKLGIKNFDSSTKRMLKKAVLFLDKKLLEEYNYLIKRATKYKDENPKKHIDFLSKNHLSYFVIQYLYMRSFYKNIPLDSNIKKAADYYKNQATIFWNDYNLYAKGQIALSLFRDDKKVMANKILNSLKENAIISDELGMYWKYNISGYYYYQAPVETQALLIEAFSEIENDTKTIDNLKIWLLKNKQTNKWKTTKATTEAVYALLLNGSNWISVTDAVTTKIGNTTIQPSETPTIKTEAGSGYFKTSWNDSEIKNNMSEVTIAKTGNGIAWGGLYWQYFENLDKITSAETPLKINKKLFLKENSDTGKQLTAISDKTPLKIGDLLTVRIEIRADRELEFIHMKDLRAAGLEPINVLSSYKWQDNLGYYQSTKDAATNFFFDRLPKGVYVFEYDVRVNNAGNFSNGITTIQSMYAPEFSSHSKGTRLQINK